MLTPRFYAVHHVLPCLAGVFLCLVFSIGHVRAAPLAVTVVVSENTQPYLEFFNTLRGKLSGKNITFAVVDNLGEPLPASGLVVAVGMKAATVVAASKAPAVLNVLIPKSGYDKLLHDFPLRAQSRAFSAILMDQPVERHIRLIEVLLPDRRRIGIMYGNNFSEESLKQIRQHVIRHKSLIVHEQKITPDHPLQSALHALLRDGEVLLMLPDDSVYNSLTIRNILLTTYRSGIPVIGFSQGYVKAGALGAVFSTPAQIAAQADLVIRQFESAGALPAPQYPQMFEVAVNEQVARSLGISIIRESELHRTMVMIPGDEP